MSMDRIIREEARLIMLKALDEQPDGRLNSALLGETLKIYGISRPRDWVHDELGWLAGMGAVKVTEAGTVRTATLLGKGRDHVQRHLVIEGVKRPSPPEG